MLAGCEVMAGRGGTTPPEMVPTPPCPPPFQVNMKKPLSSPLYKPEFFGFPLLQFFCIFPGPPMLEGGVPVMEVHQIASYTW